MEATDPKTRTGAPLQRRIELRLISAYERFEQLVVLALSVMIALVIVMTLVQLYQRVLPLIVGGVLDPLDHALAETMLREFRWAYVRATLCI